MNRTTIDFGIDLGTTNSEIAVLRGVKAEVIRNNIGIDYIPSAVYVNKNGNVSVGHPAKGVEVRDPANICIEFKRNMGTDYIHEFPSSKKKMRSEELSSEVLKALRLNAMNSLREDITAAVITVPAAFELPQCEATQKAARLAGFEVTPLLQEPIAAAMAYGFQSQSDKVYWLIYDLGGGTFDAALINMRDGIFRVVNHGGDNFLGGKNIDEKIVDQIVIPSILRESKLEDFHRGNSKWNIPIAKLKGAAEIAKIELSTVTKGDLEAYDWFEGEDFICELTRDQLAQLAEPLIAKTIRICKQVLADARVHPDNIEKVILVGGPTKAPYLRDMLEDSDTGLGIPIEVDVDPFTVVAQGAAIFAGTQRFESKVYQAASVGQFRVELDYQPVGSDEEPVVGGKVIHPDGGDLTGHFIELHRSQWRSGNIVLAANGSFLSTVFAERGVQNRFEIRLLDPKGTPLSVSPDQFTYTIGNAPANPPLIHSIGIALANNETAWFFKKGVSLPARERKVMHTALSVKRGDGKSLIHIPVIEGENQLADRNSHIGYIEILSDHIRRDVPAGSEVEVTLTVNESRIITTTAYLPILDEEFEKVLDLKIRTPTSKAVLEQDLGDQKERLEVIQEKVDRSGDARIEQGLQMLEEEQSVDELESLIQMAENNPDAANQAQHRLTELKIALDQLDSAVEWPMLVEAAEEEIDQTEEVVNKFGNLETRKRMSEIKRDIRQGIQSKDADILRQKTEEMSSFRFAVLSALPEFHVSIFNWLEQDKHLMRDPQQAQHLLSEGRRAIQSEDLDRLKNVNRRLVALLPETEKNKMGQGFGSTVIQ
jgi:molecular chaperone DnaK